MLAVRNFFSTSHLYFSGVGGGVPYETDGDARRLVQLLMSLFFSSLLIFNLDCSSNKFNKVKVNAGDAQTFRLSAM